MKSRKLDNQLETKNLTLSIDEVEVSSAVMLLLAVSFVVSLVGQLRRNTLLHPAIFTPEA